jgi:hypothetical protein
MSFARWGLVVVAVVVGVVASARWSLQAQDRAAKAPRAKGDAGVRAAAGSVSVQDALLRPLDLPFEQETTLEEVRLYLAKTLGAQVVLDRSALDRLELKPEDTVQLDLKGVRLKVGLKLVLDQVGMSYRVVPEDNLLILTDAASSDDVGDRVLAELKSLHREMHDLQDAVEGLRDLVEEEHGVEPERSKHPSTLVKLGRSKPSRPLDRARVPRTNRGARD